MVLDELRLQWEDRFAMIVQSADACLVGDREPEETFPLQFQLDRDLSFTFSGYTGPRGVQ